MSMRPQGWRSHCQPKQVDSRVSERAGLSCTVLAGMTFVNLLGVGALASSILGMCLPRSLGDSAWVRVLFVPWLLVVLGLQVTLSYRLKKIRKVLCREDLVPRVGREVLLRVAEQVLISIAFLSLVVIVVELSPYSLGGGAGTAGIALGTGICCLALLRGRMVIAEHRQLFAIDRRPIECFGKSFELQRLPAFGAQSSQALAPRLLCTQVPSPLRRHMLCETIRTRVGLEKL
eukprot:s2068_g6.t1